METKAGVDQILSHEISKSIQHNKHVHLLIWQHPIYHYYYYYSMCVCVGVCACMCMYVCARMCVHTYVCLHVCVHVCFMFVCVPLSADIHFG